MEHCFHIFTSKWSYTRFLGKTLMDQPVQLSLLLAENELEWPAKTEEERGPHTLIVQKRKLNSFYRDAVYQKTDLEEGGHWESGDFIAHVASGSKYSLMIDVLQGEGLRGIPLLARRYEFPLPVRGTETEAGMRQRKNTLHPSVPCRCCPQGGDQIHHEAHGDTSRCCQRILR
jgi:hypothetical protein